MGCLKLTELPPTMASKILDVRLLFTQEHSKLDDEVGGNAT